MSVPAFDPREGGVKLVFDVQEADVEQAVRDIAAAGFDVRRYYAPENEHRRGGSSPGWIRLGAERPLHDFSDAERERIVTAFDVALKDATFTCRRMGTDVWTAG